VGGARGGMQVRVRHGAGPRGRCLALAVSLGLWAVPAGAGDARETLRAALEAACEPPADAPLAGRVPGARAGTREPIRVRGMAVGSDLGVDSSKLSETERAQIRKTLYNQRAIPAPDAA